MHPEARAFLDYCRNHFGAWYHGKRVLDVGSGDINGNNREYFRECEYTGCDVSPGPNVSVVSPCHLLPHSPSSFGVVISSECFEHDMHYAKSLAKIVDLLEPGGLFVFTCASTGRAEHGTRRAGCDDSLTTKLTDDPEWCDYYLNLTADHVRRAIPVSRTFGYHRFYYNSASRDLYFVGIKGDRFASPPADYAAPWVETIVEHTPSPRENPMTEIFDKYDTDKNSRFHNYTTYYHGYLEPYTRLPGLRYLEIGVFGGQSLRAFREYFPMADRIVGIDIDLGTARHANASSSVYVEIGDQSDVDFLREVSAKHGGFDVVLDDGSHEERDIVTSFQTLFPLLNDGGLYIVEDAICIRDSMTYFLELPRHLNKWRYDQSEGIRDHCVDPAKIQITVMDPIERSVGDIVFTNSAILVYKREKAHWKPGGGGS